MPMEETEANPSKFVIRKLPPNLCEADFRKMLTDVCQEELEWFRYHPGSFTCVLQPACTHIRRIVANTASCCARDCCPERPDNSNVLYTFLFFSVHRCPSILGSSGSVWPARMFCSVEYDLLIKRLLALSSKQFHLITVSMLY